MLSLPYFEKQKTRRLGRVLRTVVVVVVVVVVAALLRTATRPTKSQWVDAGVQWSVPTCA